MEFFFEFLNDLKLLLIAIRKSNLEDGNCLRVLLPQGGQGCPFASVAKASKLHSQSAQMGRLQSELIDVSIKMETLRNSESECQSQLANLQQKFSVPSNGVLFRNRGRLPLFVNGAQQQKNARRVPVQTDVYPLLTPEGNFVPSKLWVHFDLKGAPFKVTYFIELLRFVRKMGINGVLIEWEEMFPYKGRLASAVNGNAYSLEEIELVLTEAKLIGLEVVPLVQTFGHLEWVLKLEQFAHLREDPQFPQVICIGASEAFELIKEMIVQVAEVHGRFGMKHFHMGADEVFQLGVCNESIREISNQDGRERTILWHISRVASFIKETFSVTVLAWHDMLVQMTERDLMDYEMTDKLEPVLWSYAEDLNMYLPFSNWMALKPFKNVWGASAFKGADGPMRFHSNPIHYVRNHESWTDQMTRVYSEFDRFQGLIITGWSRYDHLAILCELFPVGIPTLSMSIETITMGRPLNGMYDKTKELLQCQPPVMPGYITGCQFPGKKIYELVNECFYELGQFRKYFDADFDLNGWASVLAERETFSSPFYIEKVLPNIYMHLSILERIEHDLREELHKYFFAELADEFVLTYMGAQLETLRARKAMGQRILKTKTFARRPFVKYPPVGTKDNEL
uniref:beta-N-acetylhexosaminidase n=1 Tax=Globodera rostochiensis TaxID=31243 RepID=A0A914H0G3_GLORO